MVRNARLLPIALSRPRKLLPPFRRSSAPVDLSQSVELTIVVRSRGSEDEWRELVTELTSGLPRRRRYLTRAEVARKWGASPDDLAAVQKFARTLRLKVVSADAFRRSVVVRGSLERLGRAFDVTFRSVAHPLGTFRSYVGDPKVPPSIHPLIEGILGLDDLPTSGPHAATSAAKPVVWGGMDRRALLEAYAIPEGLRGRGQCVAVIELGGGYYQRSLTEYFRQFDLAAPSVRRRSVRGVKNNPAPADTIRKFIEFLADPNSTKPPISHNEGVQVEWTIETMTDLAMVGTIAPEVSLLLVQAPNDDQGKYHAITAVIAERKSPPSVLSCSWGGQEPTQTPFLRRTLNRWFETAAVMGMTVCCSAGDSGDGTLLPKAAQDELTAHFPASSPYVLACGGTKLYPKARIETAWKQTVHGMPMAGGGGFSAVFSAPPWQTAAGIDPQKWIPSGMKSGEGRALPDVAAKADLAPGFCVMVCAGMQYPAGGTSAAAPLWAGVAAILNQGLRARVGALHSLLYDGPLRRALRDIVAGNTGVFHARRGWDPCTGWGSPKVEKMLRVLRG